MSWYDERPEVSRYDVAQICGNGHVVNSMAREYPESNERFCQRCGAATLMACPACGTAIRGYFHVPNVIGSTHIKLPAYCHECGAAYPWTSAALVAAREMADMLEQLTPGEREELKASFTDLTTDSPRTRVAETRFKRLMRKAGGDAYEGMKSILTDVVSETVRKTIFGG